MVIEDINFGSKGGNGPIWNGGTLETFKIPGNSSGEWLHWRVPLVKIYKAVYL